MTPDEIWSIGKRYVEELMGKSVKARAELAAGFITSLHHQFGRLSIVADGVPHHAHANIRGWPKEKSEKLILAKQLAQQASLHLASD